MYYYEGVVLIVMRYMIGMMVIVVVFKALLI
jgi:hypothetical protein